jgi:phage terminase Nu1 subunit (DNA packaging protein)
LSTPRATIIKSASGTGRCNTLASSQGARIQTSHSSGVVRIQDARAQEIELRVAREQHKLIEMEEVGAFLRESIGAFRSELSGLPAACTRDLALRAVIDTQVNNAVDRLRENFISASGQLKVSGHVSEDEE